MIGAARTRVIIGQSLQKMGSLKEAVKAYREALEIYESQSPKKKKKKKKKKDSKAMADIHFLLGEAFTAKLDALGALWHHRQALRLRLLVPVAKHTHTQDVKESYQAVMKALQATLALTPHHQVSEKEAAIRAAQTALVVNNNSVATDLHLPTSSFLTQSETTGPAVAEIDRAQAALLEYQRVLHVQEHLLGYANEETAANYQQIGDLLCRMNERGGAKISYHLAQQIDKALALTTEQELTYLSFADVHYESARTLFQTKQLDAALLAFRKSLSLFHMEQRYATPPAVKERAGSRTADCFFCIGVVMEEKVDPIAAVCHYVEAQQWYCKYANPSKNDNQNRALLCQARLNAMQGHTREQDFDDETQSNSRYEKSRHSSERREVDTDECLPDKEKLDPAATLLDSIASSRTMNIEHDEDQQELICPFSEGLVSFNLKRSMICTKDYDKN